MAFSTPWRQKDRVFTFFQSASQQLPWASGRAKKAEKASREWAGRALAHCAIARAKTSETQRPHLRPKMSVRRSKQWIEGVTIYSWKHGSYPQSMAFPAGFGLRGWFPIRRKLRNPSHNNQPQPQGETPQNLSPFGFFECKKDWVSHEQQVPAIFLQVLHKLRIHLWVSCLIFGAEDLQVLLVPQHRARVFAPILVGFSPFTSPSAMAQSHVRTTNWTPYRYGSKMGSFMTLKWTCPKSCGCPKSSKS